MKPTTLAVKNKTPLTVLQRARNLIATLGMTKGRLQNKHPKTGNTCFCVRGAIMVANGGVPSAPDAPWNSSFWTAWDSTATTADRFVGQAAQELFPTRVPSGYGYASDPAVTFNNHPETTKKDMLRVLARAQELAKSCLT